MVDADSTSSTRLGDDPDAILYTTDYVRKLLAEAVYVYAAIENQGGSIILNASGIIDSERPVGYSSRIGNSFHLDIIDLRKMMDTHLSKGERDSLIAWANGLTAREAAIYLSATGSPKLLKESAVRKRRERGVTAITEGFNDKEEDTRTIGEDSELLVDEGRKEQGSTTGDDAQASRHPE
jgi:hypothetical protein